MTTVKRAKRSSDYPMLSIREAWLRVSSALEPLPPVRKPLVGAAGLVLAEDIIAKDSMPPFAAASMDGYAVISSDPSLEKSITGEQDAGVKLDLSVEPGTTVRIMTGAPLPTGADAVVPFEETGENEGVVHLKVIPKPGGNVRPVGLDMAAGETVLPKGLVLGPAEIGLLAALGQFQVWVHPRPRISIMSTGNELVAADETLRPGQIRDSNSLTLSVAAAACGFEVTAASCPVRDDSGKLELALVEALNNSDAVITSGGVSMGKLDLVKPLLAKLGDVLIGRVAMKPGKPFTFALLQGKPVFGLPGFPVSSLVCFEQFVRPALRLMSGLNLLWRPCVEVSLAENLRHDPDRTEFQRAVVKADHDGFIAYSTGSQSSGRLKSLVGANALLILPIGTGDAPVGSRVKAFLIDQPETEEELPISH